MGKKDPRVDAYIARSAPFARPILRRLRSIVHGACPGVEESIKWGMPAFLYKGPLAGMAAFKAHAVFGLWKEKLLRNGDGPLRGRAERAMGSFGRITSLADLPPRRELDALLARARELNEAGVSVPRARKSRPAIATPAWLMSALRRKPGALAAWKSFSPACRREYCEWLIEARRPETRARRLATALGWIAEGRHRNWQYSRK